MSPTNENFNLPIVSAPPVGAISLPAVDATADVAVPAEVNASACGHIAVYVESTSMTGFDPADPVACVDLVLSVSITDPATGTCCTHKMVKRVGFDKVKLALQAEGQTPCQVVEAVDPKEAAAAAKLAAAKAAETNRFAALAGVANLE
jgi:hypothetical protein